MPIQVTCSGCDTVYPVPENLAGKTIRCKSCGASMEVVAPAAKAVPAKAVDDVVLQGRMQLFEVAHVGNSMSSRSAGSKAPRSAALISSRAIVSW